MITLAQVRQKAKVPFLASPKNWDVLICAVVGFAAVGVSFYLTPGPWWRQAITDALVFCVIVASLTNLLRIIVDTQLRHRGEWFDQNIREIVVAFLRENKTTQVPPRKRTITIQQQQGYADREKPLPYFEQVWFPWLTFIETPKYLYVLWSEKEWKTPEEAIDTLQFVETNRVGWRVCLGTGDIVPPPTPESFWNTTFSWPPTFPRGVVWWRPLVREAVDWAY